MVSDSVLNLCYLQLSKLFFFFFADLVSIFFLLSLLYFSKVALLKHFPWFSKISTPPPASVSVDHMNSDYSQKMDLRYVCKFKFLPP